MWKFPKVGDVILNEKFLFASNKHLHTEFRNMLLRIENQEAFNEFLLFQVDLVFRAENVLKAARNEKMTMPLPPFD